MGQGGRTGGNLVKQSSLSKRTICEVWDFPETKCAEAISLSLDISKQRQKGTLVVGKVSHRHTASYHIRGNLWGLSLQKCNLPSYFASSVHYSEKQNSQEVFFWNIQESKAASCK